MAKDSREYGYEGEMVMSQLKGIMNHAEQLHDILKPDTDLPEWVQSKITLAYDYMQTAADYMATEMSEEAQLDELSGATLGSYVVKSKKDEKARKEHGIAVRDEIRKKTGLNVGTPMDPKLYGRKMSRGHNQQVAMKKLTGQARVNATEEVAVNSVGSGQVAGLQGEPPVRKKKKNVMSFNRFMKK
jgi:hypothetical protein